jgi:hypothetical protein
VATGTASKREPAHRGAARSKGKAVAKPSRDPRGRRRYAVVHDIDGPRVRLGILWFLVAAGALAIGPFPTALVYGAAAAVAGAQTARAWRRQRLRANQVVAAAIGGGAAVGACLGAGGSGIAVLVGTAAAFGVATVDRRSPNSAVADAGWTVQCGLPVGIAAMSMVLLARLDQGSAIALLLLVSAYEAGDYLIGSGARNPYEGPAAGICGITVITFIVSTFRISSLDVTQAWVFGALVAVLAPLGQLVASALLPDASSPASALRRLDSLLLAAPVGYVLVAQLR